MKKLIIIIVLLFSTLFNGSLTSAAVADYDHNELLDYPGYGEAMYESIVEQTTFISGRYTENKEYVNESINTITDYAKGWWNEYERISNMPPKEKLREMLNAAGGYALTVGDFIKNLFSDKEETESTLGGTEVDYQSVFDYCLAHGGLSIYATRNLGCEVTVTTPNGTFPMGQEVISASYSFDDRTAWVTFSYDNTKYYLRDTYSSGVEASNAIAGRDSFNGLYAIVMKSPIRINVKLNQVPIVPNFPKRSSSIVNNYIKDNPVKVQAPMPKAYLSCPDGTRINMAINGGTFLDVNGQVMQVSKDGTATVDSQLCNLGWEKPSVQYVDGTDRVGITTPEGDIIDAETGEIIEGGEIDEDIPDDCGMVCAIGKFMSGLGSIAKSIAGIPSKILDGLLGLFIPDSLDFVGEEFDKISTKFNEKFSILTGLKDTMTGVFSGGGGSNALSEVSMSLPAAPGFNFSLDTVSFIEPFVPRIKQILSGILFLMTIIYVYRKITGRGGVMEK